MDIEEFNRKIVSCRPALLARAQRLVGDSAAAEDLVQEVLLKLWTMRSTLAIHANPAALAAVMLRNKALDHLRRLRLEQGQASARGERGSEDYTFERADEVALIARIVDALPELQRRIFRMKEIEGYEAEDIMAITGCSYDSLRQCLSRARRRIRDEYLRITRQRI